MPREALRSILPIAGLVRGPCRHGDPIRRHRSRSADTVPHRHGGRGNLGSHRPRRRRPVGNPHRPTAEHRRRFPPRHGIPAQRPLYETG